MERFLQSDISRAYWTDMEPDLVRASERGDAPNRNEIEKNFRDRTETFMDMPVGRPAPAHGVASHSSTRQD